MNDYTVILLVPDYMTEDFGADVYISTVQADDAHAAAEKARDDYAAIEQLDDPADARPVAVMVGKPEIALNAYDFWKTLPFPLHSPAGGTILYLT